MSRSIRHILGRLLARICAPVGVDRAPDAAPTRFPAGHLGGSRTIERLNSMADIASKNDMQVKGLTSEQCRVSRACDDAPFLRLWKRTDVANVALPVQLTRGVVARDGKCK
jgi:hypothetical protein